MINLHCPKKRCCCHLVSHLKKPQRLSFVSGDQLVSCRDTAQFSELGELLYRKSRKRF
jgi:hypothetical protein